MAPPNNDFVIPSLIPPLASSSSSAVANNPTGRSSSSRTSNHRQIEASNKNNMSLVSSSPNVGGNNQRLKRSIHSKEFKRRVLSPIDNLSSSAASNKTSATKKNAHGTYSKSPSFQSPLPRIPGTSSSGDKRHRSGQKMGIYSSSKRGVNASFSKSPKFESPLPRMPRTFSSTTKHNKGGSKIMSLFGEAMETFFGLNKHNTTEEEYQLYKSIVHGSCTDDPGTWHEVLHLARTQFQENQHLGNDNNQRNKENLIRLHRLATLRFSLDCEELTATSSPARAKKKEIFEIWMSYTSIYTSIGNVDEARRIFKCIEENERVLLDFPSEDGRGGAAFFYISYANFESSCCNDKDCAQKIILRGIKAKAEPIMELEKALSNLTYSDDGCDEVALRYRVKGAPLSEKPGTALGSSRFEIKPSRTEVLEDTSQSKRNLVGDNLSSNSPKRLKVSSSIDKGKDDDDQNSNGSGSRRKAAVESSTKHSTNNRPSKGFRIYKDASAVPMTTMSRSKSQGKPPVTKSRLALTSRLARKGLSGKAKRVDCSITVDDDDSSSDEETEQYEIRKIQPPSVDLSSSKDQQKSSQLQNEKLIKVPSFKKLDLSYMWEWDPNKKGKDQNETTNQNNPTEKSSDATNSTGSAQSTFNTQLTAIDTQGSGSSSGDSSSEKNITSSLSNKKESGHARDQNPKSSNADTLRASDKKEDQGHAAGKSSTGGNVDRKKVGGENPNSGSQIDASTLSKREALLAKANLEFLPLVHEDNILRVNNSTYAKLGVIGKGGSCKVYRALSKKCAVVAIKKVKLAGMDRKAIEGYANEISLLKRLRGNPAIIQMYDSEVDIQRKSIFLVMELGEVDLNNVLQQRALSKTSRSLNMNFIRLTWQQMLSAVHCIHEERIIHSDLKPANFLFVRGALKLIDFGIAKAIVNEDTTNIYRENHIGTLNYMSPEAILDTGSGTDGPRMKIGRASDVWSLGCILYEMVYGKTPFYKLHFIQKLQAIVNPKHKINFPEEDEAEAAIDAMKLCLRRNPEERPPIIGKNGLLNEHWFLHSKRRPR